MKNDGILSRHLIQELHNRILLLGSEEAWCMNCNVRELLKVEIGKCVHQPWQFPNAKRRKLDCLDFLSAYKVESQLNITECKRSSGKANFCHQNTPLSIVSEYSG